MMSFVVVFWWRNKQKYFGCFPIKLFVDLSRSCEDSLYP